MESRRVFFRICIFGALFCTTLITAYSQSQSPTPAAAAPAPSANTPTAPATKSLRLMVLAPQSIDENTATTTDPVDSILRQSIRNNVTNRAIDLVELPTTDSLFSAAKKAEAQAELSLNYFRDGQRLTLIGKLYDVWEGRFLAGATRTSLDNIAVLENCDSLLAELLDKLEAEKPRLLAAWGNTDAGALSRELVLSGNQNDVLVSLLGGNNLGTIQNGKLVLPFRPLALGQTTTLNLEKPGFYSQQFSFVADGTKPEVKLADLYPKSQWTALLYVDPNMLFPANNNFVPLNIGLDAAVRFYPIPDMWYLRLDYGFKSVKSQITGSNIKTPDWTIHEISLATALALMPPEWVIRASVGVGFGLYLTAVQGEPGFVDPWVELPVLDIEINLHPIVVDFGLGAIFDLNIGTNLFPQGLVQSFGLIRMGVGFKW